jgi:tetratricopeptide (TPR) repeat protein
VLKYLVILFLLFATHSHADEWYYGTGLDGQKKEFTGTETMHSRFITAPDRSQDYWLRQLAKYDLQVKDVAQQLVEEKEKAKRNILMDDLQKLRNNKARCLILTGKLVEAQVLLKDIEAKFPGESTIAENIATCYDLQGKPKDALKWINKAAERNSMAMYSNLWVYKKILEARYGLSQDKEFLKKQTVSGVKIDRENERLVFEKVTEMQQWQQRFRMGSAAKHVREQLQMRLQMSTTEKDIVLASLIEELATVYAINEVCEIALPLYELTLKYGHPNPSLMSARIVQMKELIAQNPDSMTYSRSWDEKMSKMTKVIGMAVIILLLLLIVAWRNS